MANDKKFTIKSNKNRILHMLANVQSQEQIISHAGPRMLANVDPQEWNNSHASCCMLANL